jgi:hypothetical protein
MLDKTAIISTILDSMIVLATRLAPRKSRTTTRARRVIEEYRAFAGTPWHIEASSRVANGDLWPQGRYVDARRHRYAAVSGQLRS